MENAPIFNEQIDSSIMYPCIAPVIKLKCSHVRCCSPALKVTVGN